VKECRHMRIRSLFALVVSAALAALCSSGSLAAASLEWQVSGTFNDGGSVTGTFIYDPTGFDPVQIFDLTTSGGNTTLFPPFTFTPPSSTNDNLPLGQLLFLSAPDPAAPGSSFELVIQPVTPLSDLGGTTALITAAPGKGGSFEFHGPITSTNYRYLTGTITAIPEPGSALVTIAALLALVIARRGSSGRLRSAPSSPSTGRIS